jgi:hypothetical protein
MISVRRLSLAGELLSAPMRIDCPAILGSCCPSFAELGSTTAPSTPTPNALNNADIGERSEPPLVWWRSDAKRSFGLACAFVVREDGPRRVDGAEMHKSRLMGCVRCALIAVGAMFGVALLSAGLVSAADQVQLKSRLGNWCLDAPGGSNTATVVNPCDGSQSQLWAFNSAGQIESVPAAGNCLSIANATDTTPVNLAPCQTNANNQQWNRQANGQVTSALGPCLNVNGGVANPGTPVIAYHCIPDVADEQWDSV